MNVFYLVTKLKHFLVSFPDFLKFILDHDYVLLDHFFIFFNNTVGYIKARVKTFSGIWNRLFSTSSIGYLSPFNEVIELIDSFF
jgi:hypothetical protein